MKVFEQNFIAIEGKKSLFKCSFVIINHQPPPVQSTVGIEDSRSWSTNVYEGVYFNEYIKRGMISDVKKKIMINGMTSSSWQFKRFDRISISINSLEDQTILK